MVLELIGGEYTFRLTSQNLVSRLDYTHLPFQGHLNPGITSLSVPGRVLCLDLKWCYPLE